MSEKNKGVHAGRDAILGNQTNITHITKVIQMGPFEPPPNLEQLRDEYLTHLRSTYRVLDFKGIPQLDTLTRELLLEEVYEPLMARPEMPSGETWDRRLAGRAFSRGDLPEVALTGMGTEAAIPLPVEQALREKAQVVVLGDPGSGKTTLLKHLALRLAAGDQAPLPILAPLNAYAEAVQKADCSLQAYLPRYFESLAHGVAGLDPLFEAAIRQGGAVIMLDGLDEVQSGRSGLVNKVEAFARETAGKGNKLVVSSRIVGYRESPLSGKDWSLYTLLDFDRQAIEKFATKWCVAFEKSTLGDTPKARTAAENERRELLSAIDANPGVARLACNPLLLTILALIKRQGVSLPNRRVELYELYLRTLISAWSQARALDKRPVGPQLDYLQTIAVLGPLALWLRQENPTAGLVPEELLVEWLTGHFKGEDWGLRHGDAMREARVFLDSVRKYSNLLLERGRGRFGFMHLTFEEALAARGLVQVGQLELKESLAYIQKYLTNPGWRETILLAVGIWGLVREQPRVAGEVVRSMLHMDCAPDCRGENILMAGSCLEDVGELGMGRAAAKDVIAALLAASQDRSLPPVMQRDAGFILGRTGWEPEDLNAFIEIPAGPFLYGDEPDEVVLDHSFSISKYPITNSQYRQFVDANGYDQREYWSEDGWAWRAGMYDSKAQEEYKDWIEGRPPEKRREPFYWRDTKWNNPLTPVVGVSWFEAEAYCNWLAGQLGKSVRLPTEIEWERAARYTDGREYPWGEPFDNQRLNGAEFWSGEEDLSDYNDWEKWIASESFQEASTTIVGQFPGGESAEGVCDLAGNVWEWAASWYGEDTVERIVRGGSWYDDRRDARCAHRGRISPVGFNDLLGFRVFSPGPISGS